jgi:hypothetical protein
MPPDEKKESDERWKEEARKEKERLDKALREKRERTYHVPEANFSLFISGLATQVLISLGELTNPLTGKKEKSLPEAKYTIDTLAILKEKTRGNLTAEESALLEGYLTDLRLRYVKSAEGGNTR